MRIGTFSLSEETESGAMPVAKIREKHGDRVARIAATFSHLSQVIIIIMTMMMMMTSPYVSLLFANTATLLPPGCHLVSRKAGPLLNVCCRG